MELIFPLTLFFFFLLSKKHSEYKNVVKTQPSESGKNNKQIFAVLLATIDNSTTVISTTIYNSTTIFFKTLSCVLILHFTLCAMNKSSTDHLQYS